MALDFVKVTKMFVVVPWGFHLGFLIILICRECNEIGLYSFLHANFNRFPQWCILSLLGDFFSWWWSYLSIKIIDHLIILLWLGGIRIFLSWLLHVFLLMCVMLWCIVDYLGINNPIICNVFFFSPCMRLVIIAGGWFDIFI